MVKKICPVCNKEFTTKRKHQMYCSHDCQAQSMRKERASGVCMYCGKYFTAKRYTAVGKYCSHQCQINDLHQQKLDKLKQEQLVKEKRKQEKEQQKLQAERLNQLAHYKECAECGTVFYAQHLAVKYCSDSCRKKHFNRYHDHRLDKCAVKDPSITLAKLYVKYNGVCQICGQKLPLDCDLNDDRHPSIDHIIPVSKGGNHTWDNVQLLCRKCNCKKRNAII